MSQPDPHDIIEALHDALCSFIGAFDAGQLRFHYLDGDSKGQLTRLEEFTQDLNHAQRARNMAEDWMQAGDQDELREPAVNPAHTWGDYAKLSDARINALSTLRTAHKLICDLLITHPTTTTAEIDKLIGEAIRILHETTK